MLEGQARLLKMASDLHKQMSEGYVDDEWAEEFIENTYNRLKAGGTLSSKQVEKLEELYERY